MRRERINKGTGIQRCALLLASLLVFGAEANATTIPADYRDGEPPGHEVFYYPLFAGRAWITGGYGVIRSRYDGEAVRQRLEHGIAVRNLSVGGAYHFYDLNIISAGAGVAVRFAGHDTTGAGLFGGGMGVQNALVFGEVAYRFIAGRAGYLFDPGSDESPVSPGRNAVYTGFSAEHLIPALRFTVGGNVYFLRETEARSRIDVAANFTGGIGYRFGFAEAGAIIHYRIRTDGNGFPVTGDPPDSSTFLVSMVPYVSIAPDDDVWKMTLKGAVRDAFDDYGFALAGESHAAPAGGLSLEVVYRF
jgi:hypothetical protein